MWGVCLDITLYDKGLYQAAIEYEISCDNTMVNVIQPIKGILISMNEVMTIDNPPLFVYGELVSPVNHPEMIGMIRGIGWHFKHQDYVYYITELSVHPSGQMGVGKKKSKRYDSGDLQKR